MNCLSIQGLILENLDSTLPSRLDAQHESHLSSCERCKDFQQRQHAIDQALATHYVAPLLGVAFNRGLKRKIRADRWRSLWASVPDLVHIGAGIAMTAGCVWLLPVSGSLVLAAGSAFTLGGYLLQSLIRFWLEQIEDL